MANVTSGSASGKLASVKTLTKRQEKAPSYENCINLASALRRSARFDEARRMLTSAVALQPAQPEAWNNLAQLESDLGRFDLVPGLFQRALQCHDKRGSPPTACKDTLLGFAYSLMRLGKFDSVWPLWEAARFGLSWWAFPGTFPWKGEEVERLLVVCEGGFGDGFNFARWLPALARRVPHVLVIVWDRMLEYMTHALRNYTNVRVLPMSHEFQYGDLAGFTHTTSILSLPAELGMSTWAELPPPLDWTPPARIITPPLDWIGFCWQAEENGVQRRTRSIPLPVADRIGRALGKKCERVVSLCLPGKNLYARETDWRVPRGVTHDPSAIDGWESTARTLLKCKRIVTTDTAVAHLSGSLGVPTLMLLPVRSAWTWARRGDELPNWYGAGFRTYRETNPAAWTVEEVLRAL